MSAPRQRRRRRRRNSTARRLLKAFEPFGLVLVLCVLSMGVITVVEITVPTKAEYQDAMRLAEARANMGTEVRSLAKTLEYGWTPSFQESEDTFFIDGVANLRYAWVPFPGLVDMPQAGVDIAEPAIAKISTGAKF